MNDQDQDREELLEEVRRLRAHVAGSPTPLAASLPLQPRRIEAAGELATVLSHRLNNLLMVIMCSAEFIRDTLSLNSQAYTDIEELLAATREAIDLTRKLKAFAGRQQLTRREVDLNQFLREMAAMLQRLVGNAVPIELQPQAGLPPVSLDLGQLHQAVRQLVLNAGESMPGGGRITIATAAVSPTSDAGLRDLGSGEAIVGDLVAISISDTGCGIPAEHLGRVLEPFFTTKSGAQGLGLSAAYGIIRQHRGYLAVETPAGGGSVFRIYLPRAAAFGTGQGSPAPDTDAAARPATGTILLVEDEDSLRRLTVRNLSGLGYQVLSAGTAEAAIELMHQHPDEVMLLVTDVGLPGMDGKALASQLTAEYPHLKVILVSGFPGDLLEQHGIGRRSGVLMKPFTRHTLERRVREVLGTAGGAADGAGA